MGAARLQGGTEPHSARSRNQSSNAMPDGTDATRILNDLSAGTPGASEALLPLVYGELRALAASYFRNQPSDHTLQPTALVHEAFLKMIDQTGAHFKGRAHFFAVAATAMRQILTDHARRTRTAKRGGEWERMTLDQAAVPAEFREVDLVALDDLLSKLQSVDARKYRVVEMRFFGGLAVEEVADVLGVSKTTVESEWRMARAWLSVELKK
jgi:RNA polymerase sigma-70 factor, ECF subfamily